MILLGAQGNAILIACILCVTICIGGKIQEAHTATIKSPRELAPTIISSSEICKCAIRSSEKENKSAQVDLTAHGEGFLYNNVPINDINKPRYPIKSLSLIVTYRLSTEAVNDSYLKVEGVDDAKFTVECTQHVKNQERNGENKDLIARNDEFCCFFVIYIAVGVGVGLTIVVAIVWVRTRKRKRSAGRRLGSNLNTNKAHNTSDTVDPYWNDAENALPDTDTVPLRVGEALNNGGEKQFIRNEKHKHDNDTAVGGNSSSEEDPYWEEAENALYNTETMPQRVGPTTKNGEKRQLNKNVRHKPATDNGKDTALVGNAVSEEDPYWEEAENALYNTDTVTSSHIVHNLERT
ncbi:hypothetical protein MAR_016789 [Mya arenaria]|uniref:Uncharacterized protein n=1 Tax=Mya arenaria TaxID=6604 RepID=A0ABY7ED74_MYAAR|nr:hypothetical protein MAR_016789 [Mya arenaria]